MIIERHKGGKPAPPPPMDAPITERGAEVKIAQRMEARSSKKRRGQMASIFAGREDDRGGGLGRGGQTQARGLLGFFDNLRGG